MKLFHRPPINHWCGEFLQFPALVQHWLVIHLLLAGLGRLLFLDLDDDLDEDDEIARDRGRGRPLC